MSCTGNTVGGADGTGFACGADGAGGAGDDGRTRCGDMSSFYAYIISNRDSRAHRFIYTF